MGKNARKKVEKFYHAEIHYQKIIKVYQDLILRNEEINKKQR